MAKAIDLTGKRFGRLTVIERYNKKTPYVLWRCKCDCGKESIVRAGSLIRGVSKSCGCLVAETNKKRSTKHGGYGTRLYRIWDDMKSRCRNPKAISYPNYGGKGISLCEEWNDFAVFREWAMTHGYKDKLTIDRIDINKNYEPNNCRWVDMVTQNNNKSSNFFITYDGRKMSLSMWAKELHISYNMLLKRIRRGWTFEKAINTPSLKRRIG